jgi:transcriptional regulator with XRE-family HTH domain
MSIASRLKSARKAAGLTQEQLAQASGVTQGAIQKVENGTSHRPRKLKKIAAVLGVSPAWLLLGEEEGGFPLSDDEKAMLMRFRQLDPEDKRILKSLIDKLVRNG